MADPIERTKGWLGIVLIVWPIARALLSVAGVHIPDIGGLGDMLAIPSQAGGTYLLAKTEPLGKEKKYWA